MTARILACLVGMALLLQSPCIAAPWAADTTLVAASVGQAPEAKSGNSRAQARDLLRRAREALAKGDVPGAEGLVTLAEQTGAKFWPLEDTPQKVRKAIEKKKKATGATGKLPSQLFSPPKLFGKKDATPKASPFAGQTPPPIPTAPKGPAVAKGPAMTPPNPNAITHLPQVKPLSSPRPVNPPAGAYPTTGLNPFHVAGGPGVPGVAAPRSPQQGLAPPPVTTPHAVAPSLAAQQKVQLLTRQAREALRVGNLPQAEALAREANRMQVPATAFPPGVDQPARILADIGAIRRNQSRVMQASGQVVTAGANGQPSNVASGLVYNPANDPTRNIQASSDTAVPPAKVAQLPTADTPATPKGPVATAEPASVPGLPTVAPAKMPAMTKSPAPATPITPPAPVSPAPAAAAPLNPTAAASAPVSPQAAAPAVQIPPGTSTGVALFLQGEAALKKHDKERAYKLFQQAATHMNELDPRTAQRLQSKLQLLSAPRRANPAAAATNAAAASPVSIQQQTLFAQLTADIAHRRTQAEEKQLTDSKKAIALLEEGRKKVEASELDPPLKTRLIARVDRALEQTRKVIEEHRPLIELKESNDRTRDEIAREQRLKLEKQDKLAVLVDEFNKLMDEERFAEAELLAKRAAELDPNNGLAKQLVWNAKFVRRHLANEAMKANKENNYVAAMHGVETSAIPWDENNLIEFPEARTWGALTEQRRRYLERARNRSPQELLIEKKLKSPVALQFDNEPLANVIQHLGQLTGVNMHIDQEGLREEGVATTQAVTIKLQNEVMLKSALNLILKPLHLDYVVKDEVLKVTSAQLRDGEVYQQVYDVGDLVIPIPNFVPSTNMGLSGAYMNALGAVGYGGMGNSASMGSPMAVMANADGQRSNAMVNPAVLAQMNNPSMSSPGSAPPMGLGPGGLGGGTGADFDSLTELITSTIQPTTWDAVGGPGSIAGFETNLSLVVSQTQEVHEEIVDLLEQLRRLQDLQVTIEVRFITLNDNFFERIGVDFDFDIDTNIDRPFQVWGRPTGDPDPDTGVIPRDTADHTASERSVKAGMSAPGVFSADLDIPFTQNSFGLAVPQFGGFDATAGAQLGFAILSDIEAFFFINAAQGDRRSNVMQAPKVTLFNGQRAYVSDTSQSPFVISVIPVVGDFAAAQQPVIVVLTEGTFMTVQAVVSHDKRFVRLTVVPFFSKIKKVDTFKFEGETTTTQNTTREGRVPDTDNEFDNNEDSSTTRSSGTTVQLPTFSFVTVTTTVSVPDGGTVLLGGIKRLSEGRNEFGVPILSKVPYVNRLFKNVGIGREAQSLMMMVTPRIIIQEEEEEKLGILSE